MKFFAKSEKVGLLVRFKEDIDCMNSLQECARK